MVERISENRAGWLAPCFRAERYVITVEVNTHRYKLLQFMFRKTDGSLFITFPYYEHSEGIVSLIIWTPQNVPPADLSLEPGGKATSHLVKYSHHPDGRAHFSQDGKVYTAIKKQSVPISKIQGHTFTVQLQGLTSFEQLDRTEHNLPPTVKRTILNFSFGTEAPAAVKIVGRWYSQAVLMNNMQSGILGPVMTAVNPAGRSYSAFLCSAPERHAGEGRILVITCEPIPSLSKDEETTLTFIGGFDEPAIVNDLSKTTSFLALSYPIENADELATRIGTIDFVSNARTRGK